MPSPENLRCAPRFRLHGRMAHLAANRDDQGTNNLLVSDVIRRNELQVWFVAPHDVVDKPLVHE